MANQKIVKEEDIARRIASVASRMISRGNESPVKSSAIKANNDIGFDQLKPHTDNVISEKISNKMIMEASPTLSRGIDILTGLITCPAGGTETTLFFESDLSSISANHKDSATAVSAMLSEHYRSKVKLQNSIPKMVYRSLAEDGAYVTIFIPDEEIQTSFESVGLQSEYQSIRDLANLKYSNPDNNASGDLVSLTRDTRILHLGSHVNYNRAATVGLEGESTESRSKISKSLNILNKRRKYKNTPLLHIDGVSSSTATRRSTRMTIPSEAVKPIIHKGRPDEPYGFIIILDGDGCPIEMDETIDFEQDLKSMSSSATPEAHLRVISSNLGTSRGTNSATKNVSTMDGLQRQFSDMLVRDVIGKLFGNTYTNDYSLEDDETISTIMFHRLLKNQKTRLLFLPESQVNYFCFDRDRYGVGRSLISKTKSLSRIYTTLFYANFMGALENAIPRKDVTITFDKDDLDHSATLESVVDKLANKTVSNYGLDQAKPSDVMRSLAQHGTHLKLLNVEEGEIPDMNVEVSDRKRDIRPIDLTTLEMVDKLLTMQLGFSPEYINSSYSPEFSSQVAQTNDVTARHISKYVQLTSECITDLVVKDIINDPALYEKCMELITGSEKEDILEEILSHLVVSLPKPIEASNTEKAEIVRDYSEIIKIVVENVVPESMADGVDGAGREHIDGFRETLTAHFMTDYLKRNSSFTAILNQIRTPEGLNNILQNEGAFKESVQLALGEYATGIAVTSIKTQADLDKAVSKAEARSREEPEDVTENTPDTDTDLNTSDTDNSDDSTSDDLLDIDSDTPDGDDTDTDNGIPTIDA